MLKGPSQTLFERHLGALPLNLLRIFVEGSDWPTLSGARLS